MRSLSTPRSALSNFVALGFDPGLDNLGWAFVKWTPDGPEVLEAGTFVTQKDTSDLAKTREIWDFLKGFEIYHFDLIAFELPWARPASWVAIKLGYVAGIIMAFAFCNEKAEVVKVHARYNPDALGDFDKKPTKPMVRKRIKKLFGKERGKTFHEVDAICVALSAIVQEKKDARGTPLEG